MNPNQQSVNAEEGRRRVRGRRRADNERERERRTEEGTHQREHVREERDDLRNHERNHPINNNDADPRAPPLHRVAVAVVRVLEDAEEQEARRHAPIQRPEEDDGRDGERERDLLVEGRERAERGRGHVLVARPVVDERAAEREDDHLGDRDRPERLGEIFRLFHLGDELGARGGGD